MYKHCIIKAFIFQAIANCFILLILVYFTVFHKCCTFRIAAEQKARATYEKLIDLAKDRPDVVEPLKFLRQREIVHFQRFVEALRV